MQEIPFFDEFGFKPSVPLKVPNWVWILLAFVVGGAISYLAFKPKKEIAEVKKSLDPNSGKAIS